MASSLNKIVLIVGFISLFHSAFSAAQHRSYLRITSQEFTTLPLDIVVQAVASLFAVMWGVLNVAGNLREIRAAAELNTVRWETQKNLPSFYIFNHRGKSLAPEYILNKKIHKCIDRRERERGVNSTSLSDDSDEM